MSNKFKCNRCGYEWESRVDNPKTCPKCKSYTYNIIFKEVKQNDN